MILCYRFFKKEIYYQNLKTVKKEEEVIVTLIII